MSTMLKTFVVALAAASAVSAVPVTSALGEWSWTGNGLSSGVSSGVSSSTSAYSASKPSSTSSTSSANKFSSTSSISSLSKSSSIPAYVPGSSSIAPAKAITTTTSIAAAPPPAASVDPAAASAAAAKAKQIKSLAEVLKTKVTAVDRAKILFATNPDEPVAANLVLKSGDDLRQNLIFDFSTAAPGAGEYGGKKKAASVDTFPLLTGIGLSTTVAFLGPCGMNTPHVHPRGNEFLTVVNGSLSFGMILENGFTKEIAGTLNTFQGTVFPQGAIHYQFNPTCAPATFVATLNGEDPGTNSVAQGFFGLNGDVVNAALGFQSPVEGANIDQIRASLPVSLAQGVEQCLKTCGIAKIPVH